METTNGTCAKSSRAPQAYKVVSTNDNEISGWKFLSRLLHSSAPHLGGMNGDIQYDIATLDFNNGEQLEDFHIRIIRLQQGINLSGETVSHTRLLFHYTKEYYNSKKLKLFIAPKKTDLITLLENSGTSDVYTGLNIHVLYRYLEMIGSPTKLNTSGQRSHNFGPSYSINNYTKYLQKFIEDLHMR